MAPSKPPYDPIVSVEGMYKGSLTRLGYFFKDPKRYGDATLAVLRETAKRYDDALDDCLIQILDAKWLLEHQLAQNRARRAREAAETKKTANKRTLESVAEGTSDNSEAQQRQENPPKRIKVQRSPGETALAAEQADKVSLKDKQMSDPASRSGEEALSHATKPGKSKDEEIAQTASEQDNKNLLQAAQSSDKKNGMAEVLYQDEPATASAEESREQKEQAGKTANEEDMNFESMFGDADASNDQHNELNFDLHLNPDTMVGSNPFDSATHDATSLELLPGLESYANASGEDYSMLNLPASTVGDQPGIGAPTNNFDLPEIQGDNSFNELFTDGDFGGDASLMDLDLENGFFDT